MNALVDVVLLMTWALAAVLFVLAWLGLAVVVGLLVGRAIRRRDAEVPVEPETREMTIIRPLPTDTVEMSAVRR